jgi:hypothetical protein
MPQKIKQNCSFERFLNKRAYNPRFGSTNSAAREPKSISKHARSVAPLCQNPLISLQDLEVYLKISVYIIHLITFTPQKR